MKPTKQDVVPIESAFRFCPGCGKQNPSIGQIPFSCDACQMSNFFGPVAAVGALVTNENDELFLVRRARDPGKGQWGLPGGFVDRGESVEEALAREVYEETQMKVTSVNLLTTRPNEYKYKGVISPVIDLFYCCDVESRDQIKLAEDELDHFVWVRPTAEHLENMAFISNRIAIELWLEQTSG